MHAGMKLIAPHYFRDRNTDFNKSKCKEVRRVYKKDSCICMVTCLARLICKDVCPGGGGGGRNTNIIYNKLLEKYFLHFTWLKVHEHWRGWIISDNVYTYTFYT